MWMIANVKPELTCIYICHIILVSDSCRSCHTSGLFFGIKHDLFSLILIKRVKAFCLVSFDKVSTIEKQRSYTGQDVAAGWNMLPASQTCPLAAVRPSYWHQCYKQHNESMLCQTLGVSICPQYICTTPVCFDVSKSLETLPYVCTYL